MPDIDLSDCSDNEMFDELYRRHRAVVVLVMDESAERDRVYEQIDSGFRGGKYTAIGMAQQFIHGLLRDEHTEDDDA